MEKKEFIMPEIGKYLIKDGIKEADNIAGNVAYSVVKTLKENKKTLLGLGLGAAINVAAHALDLDTPLQCVGLEDIGFDAFSDNAADVVMIATGGMLGYQLLSNAKDAIYAPKTNEELAKLLGVDDFSNEKESLTVG